MVLKKGIIILIHILIVFLTMDLLIGTLSHTSVHTLTTDLSIQMYTYADQSTQEQIRQSLITQCQEPQGLEQAQFLYCTDEGIAQLQVVCSQPQLIPQEQQAEVQVVCAQLETIGREGLCEMVTQSQNAFATEQLDKPCLKASQGEIPFETFFGLYMQTVVDETIESAHFEVEGMQSALGFLQHPWFDPSVPMVLLKLVLLFVGIFTLCWITPLTNAMKHLIRITRSIGIFLILIFVGLLFISQFAQPDTTELFSGQSPSLATLMWLVVIVLGLLTTIELLYAGIMLLVFWLLLRIYVSILTKQELEQSQL